MDILRRPAGSMTVALILSILYGVIRTGKLEVILNLWAIVGISLLVLAIHELGHVVFGVIGGLTFKFMTVGPITIQKEKGKLRIRANKLWAYFGGVATLVPPSIETPNLSKMGVAHFRWTNYEFTVWYYFRLHIHGELLSISFIFFLFPFCNLCGYNCADKRNAYE